MLIPWDEALGVHPQAEGFTSHQVWDFEHTRPEQYPLLLHFPYFDLYRKQVVKQADLVLALHVCGDAFSAEQKARNFAYYEALTVRDSSLSAGTQAVVAAEVGHLELAYDYFAEAALIDLRDLEQNTRDGLHIASLAGALIAAVAGFGGLRDHGGKLSFAPRLPSRLDRLAFRLVFQGRKLKVEATQTHATYTLLAGAPLEIGHHGKSITASTEEPVTEAIPIAVSYPPSPSRKDARPPDVARPRPDASARTESSREPARGTPGSSPRPTNTRASSSARLGKRVGMDSSTATAQARMLPLLVRALEDLHQHLTVELAVLDDQEPRRARRDPPARVTHGPLRWPPQAFGFRRE